jgi:hypothetical protein
MTRWYPKLDKLLREPGGLLAALIIGTASATSMVAAYHQMVGAPARDRDPLKDQPDVAELVAVHKCVTFVDVRCT